MLARKVHPVGQLFGRVWKPQTIRGTRGGHGHFPAKGGQKRKLSITTWISHHQSIENSFLSSHKNIQLNWPKNGWVGQKKYAQIWACVSYLGHSLVKHRYFWIKPKYWYLTQSYCPNKVRKSIFGHTFYGYNSGIFMPIRLTILIETQDTIIDYRSIGDDKSKLWCLFFIFWVNFGGKMGVATTRVPYGMGPPNPTKILTRWANLLDQPLSRNHVFKIFRPELPLTTIWNLKWRTSQI